MTGKLFSAPAWRKTSLGEPIALWSCDTLENLQGQNPILIIGGVHGDEPEGVRLAEDTLAWLKSTASESALIKRAPWILIPCLNVDGFKKGVRVNGRSVDLNRNYPSRDWAPTAKAERYFPGSGPGSEPEIQAVVELIERFSPRLIIHCHSWKPCIVGSGAPSKLDAKRLGTSSGYEVIDDIGYPTPGSLSSFGWHDKQIPVICIEEQEGLKDTASIWPRFERGMRAIFEDLSSRRPTSV